MARQKSKSSRVVQGRSGDSPASRSKIGRQSGPARLQAAFELDEQMQGVSAVRPKVNRVSRVERTHETRRKLLHAATEIIGEEGYAKATISKITARAELALGTFYTYFESREDLFDQLLPLIGEEMLIFIRERLVGVSDLLQQEETGLRAYFQFMDENPGFYRLLNEAETSAPVAYQKHFDNLTRRYVRAIEKHRQAGELGDYAKEDIEQLVYMLMSMRNYLTMRYGNASRSAATRNRIVAVYMNFIRGGLLYKEQAAAGKRRAG